MQSQDSDEELNDVRQLSIDSDGATDNEVEHSLSHNASQGQTEIIPGESLENDADLLDDVDLDSDELDVSHLKVRSIRALGLSRFAKVKSVCFRQNIITSMDGLEELPADLEELDLYDNRIEHIGHTSHFTTSMTSLDLSFNTIKHIRNVDHLTGLTDLYLCQNLISRINRIESLVNLKNLELGANKIREIKNLDNLVNLEQLWLGKNKITKLEGLGSLKKLKILSIQANRIVKLENLNELTNLEELYIANNGIEHIEGLENNTNLKVLDITHNRVEKLENLKHLQRLEEFWAGENKISSFKNVEEELGKLPNLHTVYFERNPLEYESGPTYRNKVRLSLGPSLTQIDATFIKA